jgi:hypothetical protein
LGIIFFLRFPLSVSSSFSYFMPTTVAYFLILNFLWLPFPSFVTSPAVLAFFSCV